LMLELAEPAGPDERTQYFNDTELLIDKLLWKEDLWFGKAIVMRAHIQEMKGNIKGARELIEEPSMWQKLQDIDGRLRHTSEHGEQDLMKYSPMAECRYMLGEILYKEAKKQITSAGDKKVILDLLIGSIVTDKKTKEEKRTNGALQHLLNVFIQYPSSAWAPKAGSRVEEIENILARDFGKRIKSNVTPEMMEKVEQAQFLEARTLYNRSQYKEAAESYERILNLFPEGEISVAALCELIRCYTEIDETLYQEVVIRYMGERFSKHKTLMESAGNQLVRLAEWYGGRQMPEKRLAIYNLYFKHYTKHPRTPSKLFQFGEERLQKEDIDNAFTYFNQITKDYTNSPFYFDAMAKIAHCHSKMGEPVQQVKTLLELTKTLKEKKIKTHQLVAAKFQLAGAYKDLDIKYIPNSVKIYNELIKLLLPKDNPYQKSPFEKKNNALILQGSMFYKAQCYTKLKGTPQKEKAYKTAAVKTLDGLLTKFPQSEFAAPAFLQVAVLYSMLGDADNARSALTKLKQKHKDSPEAKMADFMLAMELLKQGRKQEATRLFKDMFSHSSVKYTKRLPAEKQERQILIAGKQLLNNGEYKMAIQAFDRILSKTKERIYRESALANKGRALTEQKKYRDAVETYDLLFEEYPNSGYTIEAAFYLSRAASELARKESDDKKRFGSFNKSIQAMKKMRQHAKARKDTGKMAESDVEIARINELKAQSEEEYGNTEQDKEKAGEYRDKAVATYQQFIMFANYDDPKVRPHLGNALHECINLFIQIERWENAIEDAKRYEKLFKKGPHLLDVRKWKKRAEAKLATQRALTTTKKESPAEGTKEDEK
ncbi:tetratricopeptide repeat protein, partial [Verrucomicrobiota bacterium]